MKEYIINILPRISRFNESLDKKELLIDRLWLVVDNESFQRFIFKRDGKLIITINSEVEIGSWEYISSAKSLLIVTEKMKILLTPSFFNKGILVLKRGGSRDMPLILINENVIENKDVVNYLENLSESDPLKTNVTKIDKEDEYRGWVAMFIILSAITIVVLIIHAIRKSS